MNEEVRYYVWRLGELARAGRCLAACLVVAESSRITRSLCPASGSVYRHFCSAGMVFLRHANKYRVFLSFILYITRHLQLLNSPDKHLQLLCPLLPCIAHISLHNITKISSKTRDHLLPLLLFHLPTLHLRNLDNSPWHIC